MADVPNVHYINFVDTKLTLQFDASGRATARLTANDPVVDITGFRKVNILGSGSYSSIGTCSMLMGQIEPGTMAASYDVPLDGKIHTFDVHGPQMIVLFDNGPANTTKQIQLMIYLRS
jgi:hypothetical protein